MSEPPPPQLPYLFFHSPDARYTENVADWSSHLSNHLNDDDDENPYGRCFLRLIEYCKCSMNVEHEFLVFHFGHWINNCSSAVGVVCADRTVHSDNSASSSGLVSPSPSSTNDNVAHDTVTIIGSPHDATQFLNKTYGPFKTLCMLKFSPSSPPSALQVSVVLSLVHDHSQIYQLYQRQCYWFADTVWKSLERLFPENEELCAKHKMRCHCGPFHLASSRESVDVVCEKYNNSAWNNTLQRMSQARSRRAAQQEQFREAAHAERQREIDEIQAQVREQDNKIKERDNKIKERDNKIREIDEMRAQWQREAEERQREAEELRAERQREAEELRAERQREAEELRAERQREAERTQAMEAEIQQLRADQATAGS